MKMLLPAFNGRAMPRRTGSAGFTLIEMMIAITIGLGILAGLVGVLASTSSNSKTNDRTAELMTNGRYAINSIKSELREAGFRGYTWAEPSTPNPWVAPTTGCAGSDTGASVSAFVSNLRQGVWGANNENPFAGNCIPETGWPSGFAANNDVLVIRRLATTPMTAALAANAIYFHSTYERGQMFRGTVAPVFKPSPVDATIDTSVPQANFAVQVYVYYISPFTVSATESPLVPALFRVALLSDGTMARELVASGVERMQVQFGRLSTALDTQYFNAGDAPLIRGSSFTDLNEWDDVNSVRIWLLARNSTPEPGYVNSNTYTMGDQSFTPNDSFRRELFLSVVQLRN